MVHMQNNEVSFTQSSIQRSCVWLRMLIISEYNGKEYFQGPHNIGHIAR